MIFLFDDNDRRKSVVMPVARENSHETLSSAKCGKKMKEKSLEEN